MPHTDELKQQLGLHIIDLGVDINGIKTINIGYCNSYFDPKSKVIREAKGADVQITNNDKLIIRVRGSMHKGNDSISYTVISYQLENQLIIELGYGRKDTPIADRVMLLDLDDIPVIHIHSKKLNSEIKAIAAC